MLIVEEVTDVKRHRGLLTMYTKVSHTDLLSHTAAESELAHVHYVRPRCSGNTQSPKTHLISHMAFSLTIHSTSKWVNSRGSIAPIQLSVASQLSGDTAAGGKGVCLHNL